MFLAVLVILLEMSLIVKDVRYRKNSSKFSFD